MSPSSIEVRLLPESPGPEALGKLAEQIRKQSGIGNPQLLAREQDFKKKENEEKRKRANERIISPAAPWQRGQALEKTLFEAVRKQQADEIRFRTTMELAQMRDSFNRLMIYTRARDTSVSIEERNNRASESGPLAADRDLRISSIQYCEMLIDDLLTTVTDYAAFWARESNRTARSQLPEAARKSLEGQERVTHAMLLELQRLLPLITRIAQQQFFQLALDEDEIAQELHRLPENQTIEAALKVNPNNTILHRIPVALRNLTAGQLRNPRPSPNANAPAADPVFRLISQQLADNAVIVGDNAEEQRKNVRAYLNTLQQDIQKISQEFAKQLPPPAPWEAEVQNQLRFLHEISIPDEIQNPTPPPPRRRTATMNIVELAAAFPANAPLQAILKILRAGGPAAVQILHDPWRTVLADFEALRVLRAGTSTIPPLELLNLPATTDGVATGTRTLEQLREKYPGNQALEDFCRHIPRAMLGLTLDALIRDHADQLRRFQILNYGSYAEKRLRDLFRIGQEWTRPDGTPGAERSRIANKMYIDAMVARANQLLQETIKSGNVLSLGTLVDHYHNILRQEMHYHRRELDLSAQLIGVLVSGRHFGPDTRPLEGPQPHQMLNDRQMEQLRAGTLPQALRDELEQEWERYGNGLEEYIRVIEMAVQRHNNAMIRAREAAAARREWILKNLSQLVLMIHQITWAVPDYVGLRGIGGVLEQFESTRGLVPEEIRKKWNIGNGVRELIRLSGGGQYVVDREMITRILEVVQGEFIAIGPINERFLKDSEPHRRNIIQNIALFRQLRAAVPARELALVGGREAPIVDRLLVLNPRPAWLPADIVRRHEEIRELERKARAALVTAPSGEAGDVFRKAFREAAMNLEHVQMEILELYLADPSRLRIFVEEVCKRYAAARKNVVDAEAAMKAAAGDKVLLDTAEKRLTAAREELRRAGLDAILAYDAIQFRLDQMDLPGLHQTTVRLMDELAEKIRDNSLRFHESDLAQHATISTFIGAGATGAMYLAVNYGSHLPFRWMARSSIWGVRHIGRWGAAATWHGAIRPMNASVRLGVRGFTALAGEIAHDIRAGVFMRSGVAGVEVILPETIRSTAAEFRSLHQILRQTGRLNPQQLARFQVLQNASREFLRTANTATRMAVAKEMLGMASNARLTAQQMNAIIAAHNILPAGPNGTFTAVQIFQKARILRYGLAAAENPALRQTATTLFTEEQASILIRSWVTGAGPTEARTLTSAAQQMAKGALNRGLPLARGFAAGYALGVHAGSLIDTGMEFFELNAEGRRKRIRDEFVQSMNNSAGFTREGQTYVWIHDSTGQRIDITRLIDGITNDQLMSLTPQAIAAAGGLTAAIIAMCASGPAGWVTLAATLLLIPIVRQIRAEQRGNVLMRAARDLPPFISAHLPLTSIFGDNYMELYARLNGARGFFPQERDEGYYAFAFNAVVNEMRQISPFPLSVLGRPVPPGPDWVQRMWQDRDMLAQWVLYGDTSTPEKCQLAIRRMAHTMLARYMCVDFDNARHRIEWLTQQRKKLGGVSSGNAEAAEKMDAEIDALGAQMEFLGGQYYAEGRTVAEVVLGGQVQFGTNHRRTVEFGRGPNRQIVRFGGGPELSAGTVSGITNRIEDNPLIPHEFANVVAVAGLDLLRLYGAREAVITGTPCFVVDGEAGSPAAHFIFLAGHWHCRIAATPNGIWNRVGGTVFNRETQRRFYNLAVALSDQESGLDRQNIVVRLLTGPGGLGFRAEQRGGKTVYVRSATTEVRVNDSATPLFNRRSELILTLMYGQWMYCSPANPLPDWEPVVSDHYSTGPAHEKLFTSLLAQVIERQSALVQETRSYSLPSRLFGQVMQSLFNTNFQGPVQENSALQNLLFINATNPPLVATDGLRADTSEDAVVAGDLLQSITSGGRGNPNAIVFRRDTVRINGIEHQAVLGSGVFGTGKGASVVHALALRESRSRGAFVVCTGTGAPDRLRNDNLSAIDQIIKERTDKQRRDRDQRLAKEFGAEGMMHNARLSTAPVPVAQDSQGNRTWQMRVGNDVALVQIGIDGSVIGFTLVPHLGTPPLTWQQREEKYFKEFLEKYIKESSAIANEKGEREYNENRARKAARDQIAKEQAELDAMSQDGVVTPAERAEIETLRKFLETTRKANGGSLTGLPNGMPEELRKMILSAVPGESVSDYVNTLVQQDWTINGMGPSLVSRIAQGQGLPTRRDIEQRMATLYRELCTGLQQAQPQEGPIPGDSIAQRARFRTAVYNGLRNAGGPTFQFDHDFSLNTLESRVRVEIQSLNTPQSTPGIQSPGTGGQSQTPGINNIPGQPGFTPGGPVQPQ